MKSIFVIIALNMFLLSCDSSYSDKNKIVTEPQVSISSDTIKQEEFINQIVMPVDDSTLAYKVFDIDKFENSNNSQLTVNASLVDEFNSNKAKKTLLKIYDNFKSYDKFENYKAPSVVATYLYLSEQQGREKQADWIGMLVKPEGEPIKIEIKEPSKTNTIVTNDQASFEKEDKLAELQKYLASKGLDLCGMYRLIGAMEQRNGEIAYQKFPENAISRSLYQESLNEKDREMLNEKYDFDKYTIAYINTYGMKQCE